MNEARPVILIGAARSGTKFVRDLLGASPVFARIPYDVNYVWRMGARVDHDVLVPDMLDDRARWRIRNTLNRLARKKPGDGRRLLEKTVSNTLRVPYVDAVLPDAVFIHLVRDGRAVVESAMRMWQAPPDSQGLRRKLVDLPWSSLGYAVWFGLNQVRGRLRGRSGGEVWGPRYPGIFCDIEKLPLLDIVSRQWEQSVSRATLDLKRVAQERVYTVRYEDLMGDVVEIDRLCDFLQIDRREAIHRRFAEQADRSNMQKWRDRLSEDEIATIWRIAGDMLRRYRYI
ncbi:sulfotransferase family protein [Mesorhizobium sp. J18]|uniref:sulfotransferase family protein n=1 Tax=Mesorhizobium sp. J18 TaxID=935263 RepID=UPI00119AFBC0|nr:sulfotransferase [Mesorhizobium sp. J18]TWG94770.1 sulfotransferase family protein [Mesorhizobium sp. J18]